MTPFEPTAPTGHCPLCEGAGQVATACSEPICARKGYFFIPAADFEAIKRSRRPADPLLGTRIGNWLAVGQLGAGAFGVVYRVQAADGRVGALKVLARRDDNAERSASTLKKFRLEAEALAALDHPNIVGLLDVGTAHDQPYLVMEYVTGGLTLKRLIDQHKSENKPLQAALCWHVVRQILSALGSAHAPPRRIVHRDLKPENIMLQEKDGDPAHVKVLDFGLAKFVEDGTETTQAMGTPAYMAPEQLWKQGIGPWTDLYAVGIVIFELLLGKRPFAGTADEIVQKKATAGYDVLTEAAGSAVDGETAAFLRRALAFDPADRFGDADDMARAFDVLPSFVGLAAAYGDEVEVDPEKLRLKRMEEQMQAERRKLEEDKRKLEQDRQQLASQPVQSQVAPPPQGFAPLAPVPLAQPGQGGSKAGMFIALAGIVLLLGIGLVVGKAYLSAKAEEATGANPAAAAPVVAPVVAEPAPPAPVVVAADAGAAAVAGAVAAADAGAAAVAVDDAVAVAQPDAAPVAAVDVAVAAPAEPANLEATGAAPAEKPPEPSNKPKKEAHHEAKPTPVKPPPAPAVDPKAAREKALAEAFRKDAQEKQEKEAAAKKAEEDRKKALGGQPTKGFADELGKGFKNSQHK